MSDVCAIGGQMEIGHESRVLTPSDALLFDRTVDVSVKQRVFKEWLHRWELANLPLLEAGEYRTSRHVGTVTLLIYVFGLARERPESYQFSILHTWRTVGKLPVVIVTDRESSGMEAFRRRHPDFVSIVIADGLAEGDTYSMSLDCVRNLHRYFETPYCLIIQDDGFPIQDRLEEFVGRWDYIGAPNVRNSFRQHIADWILEDGLNGGFCLRSKRFCRSVALNWRIWGEAYAHLRGFKSEDYLFVCMTRLNPWVRFRYRVPGAKVARRFSFYDLVGTFDRRMVDELPFGLHGQTTIWQYRDVIRGLGYDLGEKCVRRGDGQQDSA